MSEILDTPNLHSIATEAHPFQYTVSQEHPPQITASKSLAVSKSPAVSIHVHFSSLFLTLIVGVLVLQL